jgi:hypothetical protein
MKKLILVTLLAVAASWVLSEARQSGDESATLEQALDQSIRDQTRAPKTIVLIQDPVEAPLPLPPTPPKARSKRSTTDLASPAPIKPKAAPQWFPKSEDEEQAKARADGFGSRVLVGRVSASEDRARHDLRRVVEQRVADWLSADVSRSWKVPAKVLDGMVQGSYVQEVTRNLTATETLSHSTPEATGPDGLYTLYRAGQKLDFSPERRAEIIGMYRHDLAAQRLQRLGGGMALALVGLAVLSGYIKADEATKGYYTNRLRLAAAAGLGAAGAVAYRFFA